MSVITLPFTLDPALAALIAAILTAVYEWYTKRTTAAKLTTEKVTGQQVIDFFDPATRSTVPAEVKAAIPDRTYRMSTDTKNHVIQGKSPADARALIEQIATNEAAGNVMYTLTYSEGWIIIEYGMIRSGGPFEAPIPNLTSSLPPTPGAS